MVTLTAEQVASYQEQGYLLLRANEHDLVSPGELKEWTDEIANWPRVRGKWMPYEEINVEGKPQLMRTEKFADYHDGYRGLLFDDRLLTLLKQLSGDEMLLFKDKINYKLPHGNGFQAHLDAPAYDHIGRIEHVTANFAVDAATAANGCLEVVPQSHKMNVEFSHGGRIAEAWEAAHKWVPVPMEPGDVLIFGSHLAHRSGPNSTADRRASLYATFHGRADGDSMREKYYAHRRIAFPPDHEREEGKDYSAGWGRYGFAAPFSKRGVEVAE